MEKRTVGSLISCFFILLLCTDFNMWGIINVYVYSYLKEKDSDLQLNDVNQIFFWTSVASNTGMQFGLFFAYRLGFKTMILTNGLLASFCVLLASFSQSFLAFTLFFGIGCIFFSGMIFLISFDIVFKLFPDHTGISSGILNAVYGVQMFGEGTLCFLLINPSNQELPDGQDYFSSDVTSNLPRALRIIALCFALFSTISAITCPSDMSKERSQGEPDTFSKTSESEGSSSSSQIDNVLIGDADECGSFREAILSMTFIKTFVLIFFVGSFGTMIIGNYKPYGERFIKDDSFLTLVGTVSGLANGLSGLFWGPLASKIHFKFNIYLILGMSSVCSFSFPFISQYNGLFFFFTVLSIFCYGGIFTVFPVMIMKLFGTKMGSRMIGIFYQALTFSTLFQYGLLEYVSDWNAIFYTYGFMSLFGLLFSFFLPSKAKWTNNPSQEEKESSSNAPDIK